MPSKESYLPDGLRQFPDLPCDGAPIPGASIGRVSRCKAHIVSRARRGEQGRASQTTGAPGRTRTDNIQLRRLALYPVELRARDLGEHCNIFCYTSRLAQA